MAEPIIDSLTVHREKSSEGYNKYLDPKWRPVLELMDMMDVEGRSSPHAVLNSAEWTTYHIPTQTEYYPFPKEDGSLSDHQRFYLEAVKWVDRLAEKIDINYLVNFPQRFGKGNLDKLDPEMSLAIDDMSNLLTRTTDYHDSVLEFTLTEENYAKLDTPKKKLAAFLLLRGRLSTKIGGKVNILLMAAQKAGIEYDGRIGLAEVYKTIKDKGDFFRAIDDHYLSSQMGEVRTIDWLDQLYHHPLITNTNQVFVGGTNKVREEFLQRIPITETLSEPETSTLGKLFNIAFEKIGLDDQCQDFRIQRRVEGRPMKLSQRAKDWAKDFYHGAKAQGFSAQEIQQEIVRMDHYLKKKESMTTQSLLLRSLNTRARRDLETELRQKILETRGRWWQKLGLTPFEINYLTEMEISRRKSGGVERLKKNVTQLKKEIVISLKGKIKHCRKWARGRIGKRLIELGLSY